MNLLKKVGKFGKLHKRALIILVLIGALFTILPSAVVKVITNNERYNSVDIQKVPKTEVGIVFGAGVLPDGTPTAYLKRRIETAVDLYKAGRITKILMSGDNGEKNYNEPIMMERYAVSLGVKDEDITLDYAGFNTYDSCYRARAIFGIKEATLVSQGYHLSRAVATCQGLGINAIGVAAKSEGRDYTVTYIMREYVSTNKALVQLVFKPKPTFLGDKVQI